MIKRYDLINVPCHGGRDSYDELQEVEDGDWVRYEDHVAEVGRISTELHLAALRITTRNTLPGLLAELCTLRAEEPEPIYDVGMDDGLEREEVEVCGARCGRGCGDD